MIRNIKKLMRKVLVIENDPFNICVAETFLYLSGYQEVVVAKNLTEALKALEIGIRFILLNIELDGLTGLDIYRQLRQTVRGKTIPIIALAPRGKGIRTECFKAGLNGVMPKPITLNEFRSVIKHSVG